MEDAWKQVQASPSPLYACTLLHWCHVFVTCYMCAKKCPEQRVTSSCSCEAGVEHWHLRQLSAARNGTESLLHLPGGDAFSSSYSVSPSPPSLD